MNFTSIRRSEIEIQNLLHSGDLECLTVDGATVSGATD
jgi:hypothetical protein